MIVLQISPETLQQARQTAIEQGNYKERDGEKRPEISKVREMLFGFSGNIHRHESHDGIFYILPTYETEAEKLTTDVLPEGVEVVEEGEFQSPMLWRIVRSMGEKEYYRNQPKIDTSKIGFN